MEHSIERISSVDVYLVVTSGRMSGEGFILMGEDILKHPDWKPGYNVLFDHRELDISSVSFEEIEKIRDFHRRNEENIGYGKSAILLRKGSSAVWESIWVRGERIKSSNKVRIFEDLGESLNWLKP